MPDDDGRASTREVESASALSEGGAKSSPLEKLQVGEAIARLCEEVRQGRLNSSLLIDILTAPDEELHFQLTSLAGQLGLSWEITE